MKWQTWMIFVSAWVMCFVFMYDRFVDHPDSPEPVSMKILSIAEDTGEYKWVILDSVIASYKDSIATLNAALAPLHDCSTYVEMQIDHRANWFAHDICSGRVRTIDSLNEYIEWLWELRSGVDPCADIDSFKGSRPTVDSFTGYGLSVTPDKPTNLVCTLQHYDCADLIAAVDSLFGPIAYHGDTNAYVAMRYVEWQRLKEEVR